MSHLSLHIISKHVIHFQDLFTVCLPWDLLPPPSPLFLLSSTPRITNLSINSFNHVMIYCFLSIIHNPNNFFVSLHSLLFFFFLSSLQSFKTQLYGLIIVFVSLICISHTEHPTQLHYFSVNKVNLLFSELSGPKLHHNSPPMI